MTRKLKVGSFVSLVRLKLVDTHRFKNGVMVLTYVPQ
jgi:hypothetical protein